MLPITDIFPPIRDWLSHSNTAIIIAPPGAGKTTGVPLALLEEVWLKGQSILMLEPRRLAARAAAARMAETLGEKVEQTVGFRIRGESMVSAKTRIEVMTEGVFTRRILSDPSLEGVGLVIFDEFHERSLEADMGLAFARQSQGILRDDLRLLVMSATLDGARVKSILPDAEIFESLGRSFPISTHYLGRDQSLSLEDDVARHVARLSQKLNQDSADTFLVFLPGQGEIHRVYDRLLARGLASHIQVHKLFGSMDFKDQSAVIAPNKAHQSKIVLATNIAETSLTLDRVSMVLDSGYVRVARYDPAKAVTRMGTEKVSKASADQRRGRAGRTLAGDCYRLWDEPQDRALVAFSRPEILDTDLSQLMLNLKLWGVNSTHDLALLDHPSQGAMDEALKTLNLLKALDDQGTITPHGKRMANMALPPRLSHMILVAAQYGMVSQAAKIAVILSEPMLGGKSTDVGQRLSNFERDTSSKVRQMRALAANWGEQACGLEDGKENRSSRKLSLAEMLSLAFPERIAKARGKVGEFVMRNGRGVYVDAHDPLANESYLAIADLGGGAGKDRVLLAAPLSEAEVFDVFSTDIKTVEVVIENNGVFRGLLQHQLGALVLKEMPLKTLSPALRLQAQSQMIAKKGLSALNINDAFLNLCMRVVFLRAEDDAWPDFSEAHLLSTLDQWLLPFADEKGLTQIAADSVYHALRSQLDHGQLKLLDKLAPTHLTLATGNRVPIDYGAEGGPQAAMRVQELYGTKTHPCIGKNMTPLALALLSPAHRPIQITKDIVSFWAGSWKDVKSEMKGRYPRHLWPDDPSQAQATARAKPRGT